MIIFKGEVGRVPSRCVDEHIIACFHTIDGVIVKQRFPRRVNMEAWDERRSFVLLKSLLRI